MIRKGRYKYINYVGFEAELFDLESDPDEEHNLAADPLYVDVVHGAAGDDRDGGRGGAEAGAVG